MYQWAAHLEAAYGDLGWKGVLSDWGGGVDPNISDDPAESDLLDFIDEYFINKSENTDKRDTENTDHSYR